MEGKVHYCKWERKEDGSFLAFVRGHRTWCATGATFLEAFEALEERVGAETGDGEVQLEFVNATPDALASELQFVAVYGAGDCDGPPQQPALYEGGYCSTCSNPIGQRTRERLIVTHLPKGDGALNIHWNPIFSESFLSLFTSGELSHLEFLEVIPPRGSRRVFYELIGRSVGDYVAKQGEPPSAGQCAKCGYREIYYTTENALIRYLPRTAFASTPPTCFAAGRIGSLSFCMRSDRWRGIVGKPGASQIRTSVVDLLDEEKIDSNPHLRIFGNKPVVSIGDGDPGVK